jgi:hypothetical protein
MAEVIYADVSAHNPLLDRSYPRRFVMFRLVNEFGHIDDHARANLATALAMRRTGALVNFGGYANPGFVTNTEIMAAIDALAFPTDAVLMLDIEHWPDQSGRPLINGDHSLTFGRLADTFAARQDVRRELVWRYGNRGDLADLWPHPPAWLGTVEAAYIATLPTFDPHRFAWQYTNGVENHTPMPSVSEPFGHCDHNILLVPIPKPGGPVSTELDPNDPIVKRIIALENLIRLGDDPDPASGDTHPENLRHILGVLESVQATVRDIKLEQTVIKTMLGNAPTVGGTFTLQGQGTVGTPVPIADGG